MDSFSFGHILSRKLYYEKFLSHYKQRGVKKWKTHKICQIILFTPMADAPLIPAVTELMLLSSFIQMHYCDHSIHCKWVDQLIAIILFWYFHYHYCQCYLGNQKTYLIQNTGKLLYESSKERRTFPWLKS